jgi:hypothetical protein
MIPSTHAAKINKTTNNNIYKKLVLTKKGLERVYRLDKLIEQTNPVMVFLQIRLSPATAPKFDRLPKCRFLMKSNQI